jgi:AcrR family transcriptional regulator
MQVKRSRTPERETGSGVPPRRMRRGQRREHILAAATEALARAGYNATSLDDIASEAQVSRVILYRHFESKADLYRAVLDRACRKLAAAVGEGHYTPGSVDALVSAAAQDPAGFRLLFRYAAREPEFRGEMDQLRSQMTQVAYRELSAEISDNAWATWAAQLAPIMAVEAVMAWLDIGQPDSAGAAQRIRTALAGVTQAAQMGPKLRSAP